MKMKYFLLFLILEYFIGTSHIFAEEELAPVQVDGVLHSTADIPCNVFSDTPEDKINLILWYKDDNMDPIFSFDARRTVFTTERQHLKEISLIGRTVFKPSLGPNDPYKLRLTGIIESDAGKYTCRVDFLMAQSSTRSAILRVVSPVTSVTITDGAGHQAPVILPPISEGGTLNVTCTARGGNPSPQVVWIRSGNVIDETFLRVAPGAVSNNLVIKSLTRDYLHSVLTCKASPSQVSATEASVTIDMLLRPETVIVSGVGTNGSVRAGDMLDLNCTARGSRPAPMITWYKGNKIIHTQMPGRKPTLSVVAVGHVRVQVEREDNGVRVTCRVTNPAIPEHVTQDYIILNVTYRPELELRIGAKMDSTMIKENIDLYLTCHIDANPMPNQIIFAHEGRDIMPEKNKDVIVTGHDLVLRNIQRSQAGRYTCKASNTEGSGVSPPINITVLYVPVCAEANDVWAERGTHVKASCRVHSPPMNTPINFIWIWITDTYSRRIVPAHVTSKGSRSDVSFSVPEEKLEIKEVNEKYRLGGLQCWAENQVGKMKTPCQVEIFRQAPPPPPANCSIIKSSEETVIIKCEPGKSSVLNHTYNIRIYDSLTETLFINKTSSEPRFIIRGLITGRNYVIRVSAFTKYGHSRDEVVHNYKYILAENRMRKGDEELPWTDIFIFSGVVCGALLVIIIIIALVRLRFRRSQHKCTVRKIPPGEEHRRDLLASPINTPSIEKKSPSMLLETPIRSEKTVSQSSLLTTTPPHPSNDMSPKENIPLQPIIRQSSSSRLQPIIKENGRAEPIKNTQPARTVLFVEPPKPHTGILMNKDDVPRPPYDTNLPPIRRNSSLKSHPSETLSPNMYTHSQPRNTYQDTLSAYPDRDHRYRTHADDEGIESMDHQFSSGSSNTLSRESGYCSPRHHMPASANYNRIPDRVTIPREQTHVFTFPSSHSRSLDYNHMPPRGRTSPVPLPSIMKKSPSVSGDVSHYYDNNPRPNDGTRYRSLPRPGKPRSDYDMDNLARYQSLDRRFDIPFTGSLPRPERRTSGETGMLPRRRNSSNRLRFADEKLFHVYPEKNKRQNAVDDDADENFV